MTAAQGKHGTQRELSNTNHLLRYHDDRLDGELPITVIEQVLQAGSEQVNDQDVVEAFLAEVVNIRNPGCRVLVRNW